MTLSLMRPLICLDCETTGLDTNTARIVELGFQQYVGEFPTGLKKEWRSLVNPGVPIPADATRVHKITDEMVNGCSKCGRSQTEHLEWEASAPPESSLTINDGPPISVKGIAADHAPFRAWPTFKQLVLNLAKGFSNCDLAGKNIRFDLRILSAEFARAGVEWNYLDAYVIDADRLEQLGEPRTLSDLYRKYITKPCNKCDGLGYITLDAMVGLERCPPCRGTGQIGQELVGAHGAMADVKATSEVIAAQLERYDRLPRDLKRLHELSWPGWIDGSGKFRFVDDVPCFTQWGKHANKPMRAADVGYWDFIIGADFPADVKQLARNAKLGKFPEAV